MIQSFEIPGKLPGLNDYLRAYQRNRYAGAKLKKDNTQLCEWYIRAARLKKITKPVIVEFHFVEPNMRRDKDNISAAARKFILDALVNQGILSDDGWRNIAGFHETFSVNKKNPRIVVSLKDFS